MSNSQAIEPSSSFRFPKLSDWLLAGIVAMPLAIVIVLLQFELTNHKSFSKDILANYLSGAMPAVFDSRWLMRVLIHGMTVVNPLTSDPILANYLLQILFTCLGLAAVHIAARRFCSPGWAFSAMFLTAGLIPLGFVSIGIKINYPYDLPAMAFVACGLAALVWRKSLLLFAIILIGSMNKETMLWLIPGAALVWSYEKGWRSAAIFAGMLSVAWAAVYLAARSIGAGEVEHILVTGVHDGNLDRSRLLVNWDELTFRGYGGREIWKNVWWMLAYWLPPFVWWRRLPVELRCLLAASTLHLICILIFGNIREVRILYELLPIGSLCTAFLLERHFAPQRQILENPTH